MSRSRRGARIGALRPLAACALVGIALPTHFVAQTARAELPSRFDSPRESPSTSALVTAMEHERLSVPSIVAAIDRGLFDAGHDKVFTGPFPALDCEHATHDIALDPRTGETSAHLDLRVRANVRPLTSVAFIIDEGLSVGEITADGRSVSVRDDVIPPSRVVQVELSPPLDVDGTTVLHVPYAGTLSCGSSAQSAAVVCATGTSFAYFAQQSIFPYVFDPNATTDSTLDAMTRELVLRVPSGIDSIATGEHVSEQTSGGRTVSTWVVDKPLARTFGMYVFAGKLGSQAIAGRSIPTTLFFPTPLLPVDQRLADWSKPVLDFVEGLGGGPLPFERNLTLVRLPSVVREAGTATFGMTLLSESYASAGDLMHEETWAHENAHLFWGITVPEAHPSESRLMSEGLATLAQLDYTWSHHFADEDRDVHLARRVKPMALDLEILGRYLPAAQSEDGAGESLRGSDYTLWAYYKTAIALDHLRVTVGEDVFREGLARYVRACSYVGCRPDDFRTILEETSGTDLSFFFRRWIKGDARPMVNIGFRPTGSGAEVVLVKDDDDPLTLDLWLELEDGRRITRHSTFRERSTTFTVDIGVPVRRVSMNPRHDALVTARSTVIGDVDFDGETDGFDVLHCTRLLGRSYDAQSARGLWNTSESFDRRCDLDGNRRIEDSDLAVLVDAFGSLRPSVEPIK